MSTTPSDTPPPLTDGDLEFIRDAVERRTDHYSDRQRLLAEVGRLRAELAETRRVADCNNVAFQKSVDELTAVNTALRAEVERRERQIGLHLKLAHEETTRADTLAAKLAAVPTPVPDLVLTPEGFEFEGQPMKVMNLTTSDRGTEHVEASIRMVTMTEWRRRREAAGLRAALGETGGTENG